MITLLMHAVLSAVRAARRALIVVGHFVETARDVFAEAEEIARSTDQRLSRSPQD